MGIQANRSYRIQYLRISSFTEIRRNTMTDGLTLGLLEIPLSEVEDGQIY